MRRVHRRLSMFMALGLSWAGCAAEEGDKLPRVAVSGTVKLDGKPLPAGAISFSAGAAVKGAPGPSASLVPVGAVISEGSYSIPQMQGPTPGKYMVTITSTTEDVAPPERGPRSKLIARPKQRVPEKYNTKSTLTAEVKADGSNRFDYDLTSQ